MDDGTSHPGAPTPPEQGRIVASEVVAEVYGELRAIAAMRLRGSGPDATLQPTDLLHEAYARLTKSPDATFESRRHFVAAAALAMRSVIVDRARANAAQKRGGGAGPLRIDDLGLLIDRPAAELVSVDEALRALERVDPRSAQVVVLRFYLGMTESQIAEVLGVTDRTVRRDWTFARGWLRRALGPEYGMQDGTDSPRAGPGSDA